VKERRRSGWRRPTLFRLGRAPRGPHPSLALRGGHSRGHRTIVTPMPPVVPSHLHEDGVAVRRGRDCPGRRGGCGVCGRMKTLWKLRAGRACWRSRPPEAQWQETPRPRPSPCRAGVLSVCGGGAAGGDGERAGRRRSAWSLTVLLAVAWSRHRRGDVDVMPCGGGDLDRRGLTTARWGSVGRGAAPEWRWPPGWCPGIGGC